jgi:hypothetical protein
VTATRYVAPLREGGSLPGLVEADDLGTYVLKFTGAGQGRKALVAEIITGELGRRLELAVPELVLVDVDPDLARNEPDQEIQDLLRASGGINLGMDYLPGSLGFDPLAWRSPDAVLAARVLWLDALTTNVDRSWRNPNLLLWHGQLWLIDHGASLYFHHDWRGAARAGRRPYAADDHVLRPFITDLRAADDELAPLVTDAVVSDVLAQVPDAWLEGEPGFADPTEFRDTYAAWFRDRLAAPHDWLPTLGLAA